MWADNRELNKALSTSWQCQVSWWRIIYSWSLAPRRLGITDEHPMCWVQRDSMCGLWSCTRKGNDHLVDHGKWLKDTRLELDRGGHSRLPQSRRRIQVRIRSPGNILLCLIVLVCLTFIYTYIPYISCNWASACFLIQSLCFFFFCGGELGAGILWTCYKTLKSTTKHLGLKMEGKKAKEAAILFTVGFQGT
jgi:hypothetical protein